MITRSRSPPWTSEHAYPICRKKTNIQKGFIHLCCGAGRVTSFGSSAPRCSARKTRRRTRKPEAGDAWGCFPEHSKEVLFRARGKKRLCFNHDHLGKKGVTNESVCGRVVKLQGLWNQRVLEGRRFARGENFWRQNGRKIQFQEGLGEIRRLLNDMVGAILPASRITLLAGKKRADQNDQSQSAPSPSWSNGVRADCWRGGSNSCVCWFRNLITKRYSKYTLSMVDGWLSRCQIGRLIRKFLWNLLPLW